MAKTINKILFRYHYRKYQRPYQEAMMELHRLTNDIHTMSDEEIRESKARYLELINEVRRHQDACEKYRENVRHLELREALQ